jgi:SAM-dependent methyltransferase
LADPAASPRPSIDDLDAAISRLARRMNAESYQLLLLVRELARVLKPDGRLALTAPLMSGLHLVPYHFCSGFSPYWYQHFLPQFGLEIESCRANGGFFGFYGQESRRFLHRITPENPVLRGLFFPLKLLSLTFFPFWSSSSKSGAMSPTFSSGMSKSSDWNATPSFRVYF